MNIRLDKFYNNFFKLHIFFRTHRLFQFRQKTIKVFKKYVYTQQENNNVQYNIMFSIQLIFQ